ncbi:hypothetical protein PHAVU_006G045000 [Phaseolus vulgaris]|uniref:RING-type E3 ubiquitin transferase n=1 Tax=Phaseolus vulgaris TaxID=3885 RepID=V7BKG6_PHAVU|nr:hypothetical protein PHAVU_006G045000g [Phaseolus vulgaris]ESW18484.1 hypothetical protein PHAVU_006G045000g [Phaseolus vulgaris]
MNHQRYHVTTESRRGHSYRHNHNHAQPVQVQEIRGHSNFHARRGNMHRGQQIDNVSSEEIIARQMLTKTYLLPNNLEGSTSDEQEIDLCIICQDEYKNKEEIGILQCGHEYHADCVRRWLQEKNVCPLCKSKALSIG